MEENKIKQRDQFLVHDEKGIVIKRKDALSMLKDIKIKVHYDSTKQIHFSDVFKALTKRIMKDNKIDYKLAPILNKKVKNKWG